jgi:hypothetical protein
MDMQNLTVQITRYNFVHDTFLGIEVVIWPEALGKLHVS